LEAIIFYTISTLILIFALLSVTSGKILRAAVYLLFVLSATAGIYFMLDFFFLAAVQLIVYVGGILVVIIFSILLTSQISEKLQKGNQWKIISSVVISLSGFIMVAYTLLRYNWPTTKTENFDVTVADIGKKLMNYGDGGYVLPFEVISILLLAAMIGAIIIAKRVNK